MWRWLRLFRAEAGPPVLRPVVARIGDPYRGDPSTPPEERSVEPRPLDEVLAAIADARLAYRPRRGGFDVGAGSRVMRIRVRDPTRIVPTELACDGEAPELVLDLALALVPVFGPLLADVRFAGTLFVDGSRDRVALGAEAAEAVHRTLRRLLARTPISSPMLIDLARRMRQR